MEIPCFRCNKPIVNLKTGKIESPDNTNSDYIMAADTVSTVVEDGLPKDVQKTGVVHPDCWKETDLIIWGFHTETSQQAIKETEEFQALLLADRLRDEQIIDRFIAAYREEKKKAGST